MSAKIQKSTSSIYKLASPQASPAFSKIFMKTCLLEELVRLCLEALPHKSFGLVGGKDLYHPTSLYPCSTNLRNTPEWKPVFESYGAFYQDPDLGFVISTPEVKTVLEAMDARRESFVGVFHSHRYLCAQPTEIDVALSSDPDLFSYIVSVANPAEPEIGVYRLSGGEYQTITIEEC
jgi:proteasome lid subunit RPN8/RPN11